MQEVIVILLVFQLCANHRGRREPLDLVRDLIDNVVVAALVARHAIDEADL